MEAPPAHAWLPAGLHVSVGLHAPPPVPPVPPTPAAERRHLLVLDVNGLLVERRLRKRARGSRSSSWRRRPDAVLGAFEVYDRPHLRDFVEFVLHTFAVAVWSSARRENLLPLVGHIFGGEHALAAVWDQTNCTATGQYDPNKPGRPLVLKELAKLWRDEPHLSRFGPSNTLLVDDSPHKAARNPPNTAIHPREFVAGRAADAALGPGGALRAYLERLADAPAVDAFVAESPYVDDELPEEDQDDDGGAGRHSDGDEDGGEVEGNGEHRTREPRKRLRRNDARALRRAASRDPNEIDLGNEDGDGTGEQLEHHPCAAQLEPDSHELMLEEGCE